MAPELPIAPARDAGGDAVLIRTLARAFQDDPALSWILPDPELRRLRLPRLFAVMIKADRRAGMILSAPNGEVVTLWRAPGQTKAGLVETLAEGWPMLRTFGRALGRAIMVSEAMAAHHPAPDDYWYLQYAGVDPAAQGKGWGGAAIRAGLAHAEAAGKPALLETAKEANLAIYLRLGFEVLEEWQVPKGGPRFWTMVRPR
ncbi:GNAT family N-acetyltransferase [Novosphingobium sp.]|uniref:GNAT family N-acetyltransferase n=1 Tax=Novosphingobium sp. TaxID=1874826 RepID=UPI0025D82D99|nr:GNAT family N-acetyltransferase [Novosphingobium sp.]